MTQSDGDEWEYEYDDNETEDFYIPVDLANVPAVQGALGVHGSSSQRGHPSLLKTKLRALNLERREAENSLALQNIEDAEGSIGKIQIVGLHTENPLLMYNKQLLSCEWNKVIGTDLIFAKPASGKEEESKPLRSLPSVDLLATGSARLVAKVARMRPKDDLFDDPIDTGEQDTTEPANGSLGVEANAASQVLANAAVQTPATQPAPSSFLGRLNAIKAKRGEGSRLELSKAENGTRLVRTKEPDPLPIIPQQEEDVVMGGT